jgi:hypothetical protein
VCHQTPEPRDPCEVLPIYIPIPADPRGGGQMRTVQVCVAGHLVLPIKACRYGSCLNGSEECYHCMGLDTTNNYARPSFTDTSDIRKQIEQTRTALPKLEDEIFVLEAMLDSTEEELV